MPPSVPPSMPPSAPPSMPAIPDATKVQELREGSVLRDVVFVPKRDTSGKITEWRSSDPSRKLITLVVEDMEPHLRTLRQGLGHDVRITFDSKPGKPMEGKLAATIVGIAGSAPGSPDAAAAPEKRENRTPNAIEFDAERQKVLVLESEVDYNPEGGRLVPAIQEFEHFTLDARSLKVLETLAIAVQMKESCLLEGDTATSKTSSIRYLAMATNNQCDRLNLDGQTDTSDLIGKFVPSDGQLEIQFEQVLKHPDRLKPESLAILEEARSEKRSLTKFECQKIAGLENLKVAEWAWKDGKVTEAMKKGHWLILDEINLAEPQILERLNSVLEMHPSLVLAENGGVKVGTGGDFEVHPNFRIFATMNPASFEGRRKLSPAFRDRWNKYAYVESPSTADYEAMFNLIVFGKQPDLNVDGQRYEGKQQAGLCPRLARLPKIRELLTRLAKFQFEIEDMAKKEVIGKSRKEKYVFTRRALISFLKNLENRVVIDRSSGSRQTVTEMPAYIIEKVVREFFLDKMASEDDRKQMQTKLTITGLLQVFAPRK